MGQPIAKFKARGIIIKEEVQGEADKTITALTFELGLLRIYAKGAAKPTSKYFALARIFAYSDFVIYKGDGFNSLTEGDLLYPFGGVTDSYEGVCCAFYLAELIEKTVLPGENCDDILNLLLHALRAIEKKRLNLPLVKSIFEFKFMQICGFTPHTEVCALCGGEKKGLIFFGEYGIVCGACVKNSAVKIAEATLYAINYILSKGVKEVFSFYLSDDKQRELSAAAKLFLKAHSDAYIKSEGFL